MILALVLTAIFAQPQVGLQLPRGTELVYNQTQAWSTPEGEVLAYTDQMKVSVTILKPRIELSGTRQATAWRIDGQPVDVSRMKANPWSTELKPNGEPSFVSLDAMDPEGDFRLRRLAAIVLPLVPWTNRLEWTWSIASPSDSRAPKFSATGRVVKLDEKKIEIEVSGLEENGLRAQTTATLHRKTGWVLSQRTVVPSAFLLGSEEAPKDLTYRFTRETVRGPGVPGEL